MKIMNKLKLMAMAMGILVLAEGVGIIFFFSKSEGLSKNLESINPLYQKLSQEDPAIKKENAQLKIERENLVAQIKTLAEERNKADESQVALDKAKGDLIVLQKEKTELKLRAARLVNEAKKLWDANAGLIAEREKLKVAYEKVAHSSAIVDSNNKIKDLQKDNNGLKNSLKRKENEFDKLRQQKEKLDSDKQWLNSQLKDYKKNYADALKKNKGLESQLNNLPEKFAEINRQNKKLIKQTAEMHYNLGVFYTRNKAYDRAVAEFENVVEIDPNDAYAHFNLGYIYAEYLVNHKLAVEHFRHYLRFAKSNDKDMDWVKKYLLTWETYMGKQPVP